MNHRLCVALGRSKKNIGVRPPKEEAKKEQPETVLKKLLASGMSVDEILEKLK